MLCKLIASAADMIASLLAVLCIVADLVLLPLPLFQAANEKPLHQLDQSAFADHEACKQKACLTTIEMVRNSNYRSSIFAKDQLRLAKLDQLRQVGRSGVKVRVKKECAELGTKVKLHGRFLLLQ
ncbi:hypothetical protein Tco_1346510 [Tanacetum coccineum]